MSRIKAIIVVALLVGGAGAGALYGLNQFHQKRVMSQIEERLSGAGQDVLDKLRVKAFLSLQNLSSQAINDKLAEPVSRLGSIAAEMTAEEISAALKGANESLIPHLETIQKKTTTNKLLVLSREGRVVAQVPDKDKYGASMKGLPAISECLGGVFRDGLYELDGKVVQVAAVPLSGSSGKISGCIMSSDEIGSDKLKPLVHPLGSDAALFINAKVKVATIENGVLDPLSGKLDSADVVVFGMLKEAPLLFSLPGGYAAKAIKVPGGTDPMHLAVIVSMGPLVEPLQEAQNMLFKGIGALFLVGVLLGLLLSGNKITKQVARLRDSVKLVAEGGTTSINADNYSGVTSELARDIQQITNGGRSGALPMPALTPSVSEALGQPSDSFAAPEPLHSGAPQQPASTLDFESLLGGKVSEPPPAAAPEPPPAVPAVPPPSAPPAPVSAPRPPPPPAPPSTPPAFAGSGPRVELPGELAGIFDEQEETREVEPIIPEQALPDMAELPVPPVEDRPPFVTPSRPPAPIPDSAPPPVMDFSYPPDLDDGGEDQITSSDYQPDATVIAQVPDELLQATSGADLQDNDSGVSSIPPPPATTLPRPPVAARPAVRAAPVSGEDAHFKEVFDEFVKTKKQCGEPVTGLSFERFADKLRKNTGDLKTRYKCRTVKFQVYVKNGKAALRATPIK